MRFQAVFHTLLRHAHWAVAHVSMLALVRVSRLTSCDFRRLIPPDVYDSAAVLASAEGPAHHFISTMRAYMVSECYAGVDRDEG